MIADHQWDTPAETTNHRVVLPGRPKDWGVAVDLTAPGVEPGFSFAAFFKKGPTIKRPHCSIHYHEQHENQFIVLSGRILIETWLKALKEREDIEHRQRQEVELGPGEVYSVDPGIPHRFHVIEDGEMLESYFNRTKLMRSQGRKHYLDDIVRIS